MVTELPYVNINNHKNTYKFLQKCSESVKISKILCLQKLIIMAKSNLAKTESTSKITALYEFHKPDTFSFMTLNKQ